MQFNERVIWLRPDTHTWFKHCRYMTYMFKHRLSLSILPHSVYVMYVLWLCADQLLTRCKCMCMCVCILQYVSTPPSPFTHYAVDFILNWYNLNNGLGSAAVPVLSFSDSRNSNPGSGQSKTLLCWDKDGSHGLVQEDCPIWKALKNVAFFFWTTYSKIHCVLTGSHF